MEIFLLRNGFGFASHYSIFHQKFSGHGCQVVKVTDSRPACHEFEPSTAEDPPCRERCALNLPRAQTSSRWCGVVVRRGASSGHLTMVQNDEVRRQKPLSS
ncbi:hypothetical protein TNCV_2812171 [Trichonephila clavipes]|nr:hypothetical protein TNCV_2812171 [Trichonephila clavipes]